MSDETLYWHDYETFGADPRRDRPAQFAGLRTDLDLNPIGRPLSLYCQPTDDYLPSPEACLITGITPQMAMRKGVAEPEFIASVLAEMGQPGTCGVGYNSLRFDDEVTRFTLYRNFHDPYGREWAQGNSRWDLIDVARLCYALRPKGVEWPVHENGSPSFRLEDLSQANELFHGRAHDALSDVEATIGLARLLKLAQPRLYGWCFDMRRAAQVGKLIDWQEMQPVLHVSRHFPATRGCLAMVAPIALHPQISKRVICVDLADDPAPLLELDAEDIADRVFTPSADLPDDVERIRLKTITLNKCPVIAPLSTLKGVDTERIGLDVDRCLGHLDRLREADGLRKKVQRVFSQPQEAAAEDADAALYSGGFIGRESRALADRIGHMAPSDLAAAVDQFDDPRMTELLFRYRARNFPETLSPAESDRWQAHRKSRLSGPGTEGWRNLESYLMELSNLRSERAADGPALAILDELESFGQGLASSLT